MKISSVYTEMASRPLRHYVQATRGAGLLEVSGQLSISLSAADDAMIASFEDQCRLVVRNFLAIIDAAGAAPTDVLKVTAYIVGIENWATFNTVFADLFGEQKPARSTRIIPTLLFKIRSLTGRSTSAVVILAVLSNVLGAAIELDHT